uniref:Uncharacterized protein n=1 Tax=Anopheles epiroticus TaxID=199890 RepID=A0A182PX06_9DIPT
MYIIIRRTIIIWHTIIIPRFGGLFRLRDTGLKLEDPILLVGTALILSLIVGINLKIAQDCGMHGTVRIDLLPLCINNIVCNGTDPLAFLDYYA